MSNQKRYGAEGLLGFMGKYPDTFPHGTPVYEDQRYLVERAREEFGVNDDVYPAYPRMADREQAKIAFNMGGPASIRHRLSDDLMRFRLREGDGSEAAFTGLHGKALEILQAVENALDSETGNTGFLGDTTLSPSAKKAFSVTYAFEGAGYARAVGSFDGMGISFGWLQWNLGKNTLQPLLKHMHQANPKKFEEACGGASNANKLLAVCNGSIKDAVAWGDSISVKTDPNNRKTWRNIVEPWKTVFQRLGSDPLFKNIQDRAAYRDYFENRALKIVEAFGLKSERGLALAFDIAVQNGSVKASAKARIEEEVAKLGGSVREEDLLIIIAEQVALQSDPQWQDNVRRRKMAIATGQGKGNGVDVGKFNLTMNAFTLATNPNRAHGFSRTGNRV